MGPHLIPSLVAFLQGEDGPTAVEYSLIFSLLLLACVWSILRFGGNSTKTLSRGPNASTVSGS
jgi:Flp pilus assembly pilin Flp